MLVVVVEHSHLYLGHGYRVAPTPRSGEIVRVVVAEHTEAAAAAEAANVEARAAASAAGAADVAVASHDALESGMPKRKQGWIREKSFH